MPKPSTTDQKTYIDLFSGCGGLSLGLGKAGWKGLFAVEKDEMAFDTFRHNLIDGKDGHFEWPSWLEKKATTIQELFENHLEQLTKLKGTVDLIAGGPPCQGFSLAGQRKAKDPRNKLSEQYIKMVAVLEPKYILLENVRGFNSVFKNSKGASAKTPYSMVVKEKLEKLGYRIYHDTVCSSEFGVPQKRTRFIMIGIRNDLVDENAKSPFTALYDSRQEFLKYKGLPLRPITSEEAIKDLCVKDNSVTYHSGDENVGFKKIDYKVPKTRSKYLTLMRKDLGKATPNSLRLARHRATTVEKFVKIQSICKRGISLNDEMRAELGTKKQAITVLAPNEPSKTLTTLPDDLLHYDEPRILTVREMARLQSFPDNFSIRGKYTTGGERRTKECPRYTQVGNAVPPLLGEALGKVILKINQPINHIPHHKN